MKAELLLVLHFHQPVGNFDRVIKQVHDRCYKPFLDTVCRYPEIRLSMHFSGSLLEWFASHTPEILGLIRKLAISGQVELLGGPLYEPILPVIPQRDRIAQIELMNRNLESLFGVHARSGWIPERVWEPHLVADLAKSGIEHIVLDDTHFIRAGIKKKDTYGYYVSEDNGSVVRVFPSDKLLRYSIPFKNCDESFAYMKKISDKKDGAIFTYGDDVEKFGEWPGTYKAVYEDGWLEKFFEGVLRNNSWLKTATLSECAGDKAPLGNAYLPPASYEEMLEWCGFFRNFFIKYREANQMHKRMLYVSNLVDTLEKCKSNSEKLKEAKVELYKGQCNCAYWHGVFGGLYLYHLRKGIYAHLLNSERVCNDIISGGKEARQEILDFDADGFKEAILQNEYAWLCVKPSLGGSVVEFDVKERSVNLLNVLTRYEEPYHGKAQREANSDKYRKAMFIDHFFRKGASISDLEKGDYPQAGDFINSSYSLRKNDGNGPNRLTMERKGAANGAEVMLVKEFILNGPSLTVFERITNLSGASNEFSFGAEFPFIMPNADSHMCAIFVNNRTGGSFPVDSRGEIGAVNNIEITDSKAELSISLAFSNDCTLWRFPIITVSQAQAGCEKNYQGSVLIPHWRFVLKPNETFNLRLNLNINLVKNKRFPNMINENKLESVSQ